MRFNNCRPLKFKMTLTTKKTLHLHKLPFSSVKLLLITKSVPLKGNSITFSKQSCFHTDIPIRLPCPSSLGAPRLLGTVMVEWDEISSWSASINTWGLPKRVELQTGTLLGLSRSRSGLLGHGRLLICSQPALLMPTICVCNSSPTDQEPQQAYTQVNKHPERAISQLSLYLTLLITAYQCHKKCRRRVVIRNMRSQLWTVGPATSACLV